MEISVHTQGGLFGDDHITKIHRNEVLVVENGQTQLQGHIGKRRARKIAAIARQVATLPESEPATAYIIDAGYTEVNIAAEGLKRHLRLPSGADAPDEVWNLLEAVDAASTPDVIRENDPHTSR